MTDIFDLGAPLRTGITVLEASAGTGKTYSLAGLATRWVAEHGVKASQLCIVSFTELATAELRGRVRDRIAGAASWLASDMTGPSDDVLDAIADVSEFPEQEHDRVLTQRRVNLEIALSEFDGASISTIHGFCTRVLAIGGRDISAPLTADNADVAEVVTDHLLREFGTSGTPPASPGVILDAVRARLHLPDAQMWTLPREPSAPGGPRDIWFDASGVQVSKKLNDNQQGQADTVDALAALVETLAREVRSRRASSRVRTYDSLLTDARDLLRDPGTARGPAVIAALRSWFRVVLIDEFQDTDRVQWETFRLAFLDDNPYLSATPPLPGAATGPDAVVLVADPKQSIYRFRSAELSAYLSALHFARENHGSVASLGVNRRSDPPLLVGLETIFDGFTFGSDEVRFQKVGADPNKSGRGIEYDDSVSVQFRGLPGGQSQPDARLDTIADVAAEVVRLLSTAEIGPPGERKNISANDIGILVRSNADADAIANALEAAGVPAARSIGDSVVASPAARQWRTLLSALERPGTSGRVRAAALGWFIGRTPYEIVTLDDDGIADVSELLRIWAARLATGGLPSLLASVRQHGLAERVLSRRGGERDLTDLDHVVELLQAETGGARISPSALLEVFDALGGGDADEEEAVASEMLARRIDRDDDTVKVLTVHKAKGLEFPIVLCPLFWKKRANRQGMRHAELPPKADHTTRFIDTAQLIKTSSAPFKTVDDADRAENIDEDRRLLYVALTRAQHRLVVWWSPDIDGSPLRELLCFATDATEPDIEALVRDGLGAIGAVVAAPPDQPPHWDPRTAGDDALTVCESERELDRAWRIWSFTAISSAAEQARAGHEADAPAGQGNDEFESAESSAEPVAVMHDAGPLQDAPRGAAFGTMVHSLLQDLDFAASELEPSLLDACGVALRYRRWSITASELANGLSGSLRAPLDSRLGVSSLADLTLADRLNELNFDLPLAGFNATSITRTVLGALPADDIMRPWFERVAHDDLDVDVSGMLTGSIDLVGRATIDGVDRYWLADYKTNHRADGDYGTAGMVAMMEHSGYALQATVYSVALHRYLRWRVRDYDPDIHLVGTAYLFLRGMTAENLPDDPRGVVFWRVPTPALLELDRLFADGVGP
jgi:exodeoxyribonuclease V beta subunit